MFRLEPNHCFSVQNSCERDLKLYFKEKYSNYWVRLCRYLECKAKAGIFFKTYSFYVLTGFTNLARQKGSFRKTRIHCLFPCGLSLTASQVFLWYSGTPVMSHMSS